MRKAKIIRNPSHIQTLGTLYVEDKDGDYGWHCDTLELPYKENQSNISSIPIGVYHCKWTRSNRLSAIKGMDVFTYEVLNVPNRPGIRIHSANYVHDLLGCIALGFGYVDLNNDGVLDLINSRNTIAEFNSLMNWEDFELTIK